MCRWVLTCYSFTCYLFTCCCAQQEHASASPAIRRQTAVLHPAVWRAAKAHVAVQFRAARVPCALSTACLHPSRHAAPLGPAVGGHAAWCALQSPGGDRWVLRPPGWVVLFHSFVVSVEPHPHVACTLPACLQGCICHQPGTLHAASVHFAAASSGPELH